MPIDMTHVEEEYIERRIQDYWRFVDKRGPADCWPWLGAYSRSTQRPGLSPKFSHRNTVVGARRWYKQYVLREPVEGAYVKRGTHCQHKLCVNPAHFLLVPMRDKAMEKLNRTFIREHMRVTSTVRAVESAMRRFNEQVDQVGEHLLWKGRLSGSGRGARRIPVLTVFHPERRVAVLMSARRWRYEQAYGNLPSRKVTVRPSCGESSCMTPAHQEVVKQGTWMNKWREQHNV